MKKEKEIREAITKIEESYKYVLTGSLATIQINAPRALLQIEAELKLKTLYWVLGEEYTSKLKGMDK